MRVIRRFDIPTNVTEFTLTMPAEVEVLSVAMKADAPRLWAFVVEDGSPTEEKKFAQLVAGAPIPDTLNVGKFVGTYINEGLAHHVFALWS